MASLIEHLGVGQTISLSPLGRTIFSPHPLSPLPWEELSVRTRPVRTLGVDQTISLAEILARNRDREIIHREDEVKRRKLLMSVQAILPILKPGGRKEVKSDWGKVMEHHPLEERKISRSVWTEEEKEIFTQMYLKNPKNFVKIAENLDMKSVKDCVLMYYLTKKNLELMKKSRKLKSSN